MKPQSIWVAVSYGSVSGLITAAITFALTLFAERSNLNAALLNAVYGFLPGFFVGAAFEWLRVLQDEITRLAEATSEIGKLVGEIDVAAKRHFQKLIADFEKIRVAPEFAASREALASDEKFAPLITSLIRESAINRIHYIPNTSDDEFYRRLAEALEAAHNWDGIHQGRPELLGNNTHDARADEARRYFAALKAQKEKRGTALRRIIILSTEAEERFLENYQGWYRAFWELNGDIVDNYLINKDQAQSYVEHVNISQFDDCAIYDSKVFLHHDRNRRTMQFDTIGQHRSEFSTDLARAVQSLFDRLNNGSAGFRRLGVDGPVIIV